MTKEERARREVYILVDTIPVESVASSVFYVVVSAFSKQKLYAARLYAHGTWVHSGAAALYKDRKDAIRRAKRLRGPRGGHLTVREVRALRFESAREVWPRTEIVAEIASLA